MQKGWTDRTRSSHGARDGNKERWRLFPCFRGKPMIQKSNLRKRNGMAKRCDKSIGRVTRSMRVKARYACSHRFRGGHSGRKWINVYSASIARWSCGSQGSSCVSTPLLIGIAARNSSPVLFYDNFFRPLISRLCLLVVNMHEYTGIVYYTIYCTIYCTYLSNTRLSLTISCDNTISFW